MAVPIGAPSTVPAEPPGLLTNKKHEDIRMWLLTGRDSLGQNSWQSEDETQRIRYALAQIDGKEVALFALTYHQQMTGDLGYTKQAGYEFWHVFRDQPLRRVGTTDRAGKCGREMGFVKYHGYIAKFLPEMANRNIDARVTGIA